MENKLAEVVDKPAITEKNDDEKMCSCGNNVVDKMCSTGDFDTCGSRHMSPKGEIVEILDEFDRTVFESIIERVNGRKNN
jgi:hypothetical protein